MLSELISQPCSLLGARSWFKMREAINWIVTIFLFMAVFFFLMVMLGGGIAFVVSTTVAFGLFFFVLDKRTVKILCNHCQKPIITNTPWVCGFCQKNNTTTDDFPFIHRCEHCGAEPKAYECHHCGQLIFLTEDEMKLNYARCVGAPVAAVVPPPPDEATVREQEARAVEHQLRMTRLNAELVEENRKAEFSKRKSPTEKVEESFSKHHAAIMAEHDIARREKETNAAKYKDDPYLLERANESVDTWLQQQL